MTNWLVTIVRNSHPFEKKKVVVPADTVIEALDEFHHKQDGFTAVSASFHSSNYGLDHSSLSQVLSEI